MSDWQVLIASADRKHRQMLTSILEEWGVDPVFSSSIREARAILSRQPIPLVFCEDHLDDGSFRDLLAATRAMDGKVRVVVTFRVDNNADYSDALRLGAFDVIPYPCRRSDVQWMVLHAMRDEEEHANGRARV